MTYFRRIRSVAVEPQDAGTPQYVLQFARNHLREVLISRGGIRNEIGSFLIVD